MVELFKDGSFTDAANNEVAVGQTISSGVDMMVRFLPNIRPRRVKQGLMYHAASGCNQANLPSQESLRRQVQPLQPNRMRGRIQGRAYLAR
jgi:hypothetical protein